MRESAAGMCRRFYFDSYCHVNEAEPIRASGPGKRGYRSENRRSSTQGDNTRSRGPRLPWSPEEQDVDVRIANLEAAQAVVCILTRCAECFLQARKNA